MDHLDNACTQLRAAVTFTDDAEDLRSMHASRNRDSHQREARIGKQQLPQHRTRAGANRHTRNSEASSKPAQNRRDSRSHSPWRWGSRSPRTRLQNERAQQVSKRDSMLRAQTVAQIQRRRAGVAATALKPTGGRADQSMANGSVIAYWAWSGCSNGSADHENQKETRATVKRC